MKAIVQNIYIIVLSAVVGMRGIIALPLAFAAVQHFQFLTAEANWLVYFVAYISIFAVEAVMTLFSFLTAQFRRAHLTVAYRVAFSFVVIFFLLNAFLLWEIQYVWQHVSWIAVVVLQVLNLASVALAESLGFMQEEAARPQGPTEVGRGEEVAPPASAALPPALAAVPAELAQLKADDAISTDDKIRQMWASGHFQYQKELARYLVVNETKVSRVLAKVS